MAIRLTWVIGVVLTVVGIWGYLQSPVFGIFEVNTPHNLVHLVTGIVGILAALGAGRSSTTYLRVVGVAYALLFVLGLFGKGTVLGTLTTNGADNVLHLVVALVALYGGFGKMASAAPSAPAPTASPSTPPAA